MVFSSLILVTFTVLAVGAIVIGLVMALRAYVKYRGERVITCPETHQAAAVHVDATQARSKRSRFITLVHAATKSFTNFSFESAQA
jgi:hypothetical protein